MQIVYINRGASLNKFAAYLKKYNGKLGQQGQKYNHLLMEGLVQNGAKVLSLSTRPINRAITSQKFFKAENEHENGIDYHYVSFFNIKLLRELSVFLNVFFYTLFLKEKRKNTVIICDALNVAASAAALCAASIRRFSTVGIVTDVPCHLSDMSHIPFSQKANLWVMRQFKSYLLLTEQMSTIVNPKNRPYIVLEGHSDQNMASVENKLSGKADKKICLYAGSLKKVYGIKSLVEGFVAANIPNTQLHIYGDGDYASELRQLTQKYEDVKYLGIAPNQQVVKAELAATLLINPRPTNEEYTKYSFPSKNMEYMASGTPVLTTKLPGMPADHMPYVYFIEEETSEGIAKALKQVLSQPPEALHSFGKKAKTFVLTEKSNYAQAGKVLRFIADHLGLEDPTRVTDNFTQT